MRTEKGFSLVEVMIAIAVLGIGMLGVISMQTNSTSGNSLARTITKASTFSAEQLETLIALPYNDANLQDTNGDGVAGINRPYPSLPLQAGQVIPDPNFRVASNLAGLAPDFQLISPDGEYTICWNVIVNSPLPNTTTIRVIVINTGRGAQRVVSMDFIKAAAI